MATMEKLDLYKIHQADYVASKKPLLLDIAPAQYLSIEGQGEPGDAAFQDTIDTLYAGAFTTKMMSKANGRDYAVCKLEALWWMDGDKPFTGAVPKDLRYKLMIRTPDFIGSADLQASRKALAGKGKTPRVADLMLERIEEGRCVQMLHMGPYEREEETVRQMHAFAQAEGLELHGPHHEVYLSDPRRVPPERLKTLLRHPTKAI